MKVYGLTGGIGMGKSTAFTFLKELGIPAIDTDIVSREIVEPGKPALVEINRLFGNSILDDRGHLRRDKLASIVFADAPALKQLEAILHPRIREIWKGWIESRRAEKASKVVVIIPLLFETGCQDQFDKIMCVACSAETQQMRLESRGWGQEQMLSRIGPQMPVQKKMDMSHHVIWTEGGMNSHRRQLERVLV